MEEQAVESEGRSFREEGTVLGRAGAQESLRRYRFHKMGTAAPGSIVVVK